MTDQPTRPNVPAGRMTPDSTARTVNVALAAEQPDLAFRLILQARDDLRIIRATGEAWERDAYIDTWQHRLERVTDPRYDTLLRVLVAHELEDQPPAWTVDARLDHDWVLDDPFRDPERVRAQTPAWLAQARIFIAERGLTTA